MRDPRLNHNFGLSGYESRQEKRRAAFMETTVGDKWDSAVDRLVAVAKANAFEATHITEEQCPQASTDLLPEAFPLALQRVNGAFENTSDETVAELASTCYWSEQVAVLLTNWRTNQQSGSLSAEHVSPWEVLCMRSPRRFRIASVRDHAGGHPSIE
jgi:hypothetical protein